MNEHNSSSGLSGYNDYTVTIMLQFPAMPTPRRINVSLRQLYLLDQTAERRFWPDGTVVYVAARPMAA